MGEETTSQPNQLPNEQQTGGEGKRRKGGETSAGFGGGIQTRSEQTLAIETYNDKVGTA
jgi:hypothetical protein